jgi:transcriptional regulator with XRE-family HTH domain
MDPLVKMQTLGEQVLLLRRRAGLSQYALAERAGVDPMTISRVESGQKKRLELETAARLARVFGISLDQLCGLKPSAEDEVAVPNVPALHEPSPALDLPQGEWGSEWMRHLAAQIYSWHDDDGMTWKAIAQRLNAIGIPTQSRRGRWYPASVSQLLCLSAPQTKKGHKEFMAKYRPRRHPADASPTPEPPAQRRRPRKAASVG